MTWWAAIGLATMGVRRRPGRALLTVLAVMLAAALMTALLTIATTAETRVLDELAKGGPLAGIKVAAATPDPAQIGQDNANGAPKDLDQAALDRIRALPSVRDVVPVVSTKLLVISPTPDGDGRPLAPFIETVVGVDLTQAPTLPITVVEGRLPAPGSTTELVVTEGTSNGSGSSAPMRPSSWAQSSSWRPPRPARKVTTWSPVGGGSRPSSSGSWPKRPPTASS